MGVLSELLWCWENCIKIPTSQAVLLKQSCYCRRNNWNQLMLLSLPTSEGKYICNCECTEDLSNISVLSAVHESLTLWKFDCQCYFHHCRSIRGVLLLLFFFLSWLKDDSEMKDILMLKAHAFPCESISVERKAQTFVFARDFQLRSWEVIDPINYGDELYLVKPLEGKKALLALLRSMVTARI